MMKNIVLSLLCTVLLVLSGCTNSRIENDFKEEDKVLPEEALQVHFLNVGQGDSILIQSPNNKWMLIDGGAKGEGNNIVTYMRELGVTKLDYVVATHPDADHIGGLISVLNSISIKEFIDSGKIHTSQTFEEMLSLIEVKNIKYSLPSTGDMIAFDSELKLEVLHANQEANDNNDASLVLKLTYGEVSFLFAGDAGIELENEILRDNLDVQATILKAGHHGSNTSSSAEFLQEVSPEVTILSYGEDNKYGHPHIEVTNELKAIGSEIYATAEVGHIIVNTNGIDYSVNGDEWTGNTSNPPVIAIERDVYISNKDLQEEIIAITNSSKDIVSLKGWQLESVEGNQIYNFPNVSLAVGKTIYVTSGEQAKEGNGYIKWTGRQIWLNDGDAAKLYNAKGEVVSEFE